MCFSYKNKHGFIASHPSAFAEARAPSLLEKSVTRRQAKEKSVDLALRKKNKKRKMTKIAARQMRMQSCAERRELSTNGCLSQPGSITAGYILRPVQQLVEVITCNIKL